MIRVADRLNHIEEYYFSKKLREVKKLELDGRPIINMGIGSPDISPPKKIIKSSHSMIYYISMLSTTGGRLKTTPKEIKNNYLKIKKLSKKKNCVIGFGITKDNIASFKTVDGLVVGSQICREISNSIKNKQKITKNVDKLAKILKRRII